MTEQKPPKISKNKHTQNRDHHCEMIVKLRKSQTTLKPHLPPGGGGRRFKSCHPDHLLSFKIRYLLDPTRLFLPTKIPVEAEYRGNRLISTTAVRRRILLGVAKRV